MGQLNKDGEKYIHKIVKIHLMYYPWTIDILMTWLKTQF